MSFRRRVLITGGAGFLGSHLCRRLINNNCDVICLDNFFTGRKENVLELFENPFFELVRHDVMYPYHTEVDEIYNLACPASPIHYQFDPVQTVKTNVLGAINMLDLAERNRAKILQASTSEVYGDPEIKRQPETYLGRVNPIGIRSCYDEGKRCAETLFFDYYRQRNVNIKVIRIFNTYGPYMRPDDGRVVSNFILQALRGEPLTIYGEGQQTRSFCYVDDLIDGMISMMNTSKSTQGPVNLGNPKPVTMLQLAEIILKLTKSNSKIIFKSLPQDDPKQREPLIDLAKSLFEFNPKITLEEGLDKTIHYFKTLMDN